MHSSYRYALALCLLVACKSTEHRGAHTVAPADAAPAAATAPVPAGSLRDAQVVDAYAVLVPKGGDPAKAKRAAEKAAPKDFTTHVDAVAVADAGFQPDLLQYFGRDLDDDDLAGLTAVTDAVMVTVTGPADRTADVLHGAAAAVRAGAAAVHGWIQDEYTSETFTADSLDDRRPAGFALDVSKLIVIHAVPNDDGSVLLESFGMNRFGLPELFLDGVPQSFAEDVLELVDAVGQALVDHGGQDRPGAITIHGPAGDVTFATSWTSGDGLASRPMIGLALPGGPLSEQAFAAVQSYFGHRDDEIHGATADDLELNAASARAKKELAALAPHFAAGIPQMEKLLVKAPFATGRGGNEYMWIEVHAWKGGKLTGVLLNEPAQVPNLKVGATVEVAEADLFDYLHVRADGSQAGGETDRILQARGD